MKDSLVPIVMSVVSVTLCCPIIAPCTVCFNAVYLRSITLIIVFMQGTTKWGGSANCISWRNPSPSTTLTGLRSRAMKFAMASVSWTAGVEWGGHFFTAGQMKVSSVLWVSDKLHWKSSSYVERCFVRRRFFQISSATAYITCRLPELL